MPYKNNIGVELLVVGASQSVPYTYDTVLAAREELLVLWGQEGTCDDVGGWSMPDEDRHHQFVHSGK